MVSMCFFTTLIVTINLVAQSDSNLLPPGFDVASLTREQIKQREYGSKLVLVVEQCQIMTIWCEKLCLLFLYQRLTVGTKETLAIKILFVYVGVSWVVMEVLYLGVWCRPLRLYWYDGPFSSSSFPSFLHFLLFPFFLSFSFSFLLSFPFPFQANRTDTSTTTHLNNLEQGRPINQTMHSSNKPPHHKRNLQPILGRTNPRRRPPNVHQNPPPFAQKNRNRRHLLPRHIRHHLRHPEQSVQFQPTFWRRVDFLVCARVQHGIVDGQCRIRVGPL
jgi:hypothetical protein